MSQAVALQVTPVSSDPSLTSLNGDTSDVTELNQANDDLRRDNVELLEENNERLCLERSTNDNMMVNIVDELKKEPESVRELQNNPQLLFTLNQPPTDSKGDPLAVNGLVMLNKYLYVVYEKYNKVEVLDCEDHFKKIEDIEVNELKRPSDMVGSSVTSQLLISDWTSDVIWRVDLKTGVSDVFVKTGYNTMSLSLVENRLLVSSRDSLLMFDIVFGERIKEIPLTEDIKEYDVWHAIESNRDSFFVLHGEADNSTVSEIDSECRVIRVLDNEQLGCGHLALNSAGRLLVADWYSPGVGLFDEHLQYERVLIDIRELIDSMELDDSPPTGLNYIKNNNRLMVGLGNGQVMIYEY